MLRGRLALAVVKNISKRDSSLTLGHDVAEGVNEFEFMRDVTTEPVEVSQDEKVSIFVVVSGMWDDGLADLCGDGIPPCGFQCIVLKHTGDDTLGTYRRVGLARYYGKLLSQWDKNFEVTDVWII